MNELSQVAPAFVEMAHHIVWCSAATVDARGRPRSRILHPYWQWLIGKSTHFLVSGNPHLHFALCMSRCAVFLLD